MSSPGPSLKESLSDLSSVSANTPASKNSSFPTPPRVHWFGVVLMAAIVNMAGEWLSHRTGLPLCRQVLSSEVFLFFWLCVQASFVQRLKPEKAILFTTMTAGVLLAVSFVFRDQPQFAILAAGLVIAGSIMLLVDLFRMRRVLEAHYNKIEPYGLSLNWLWLMFLGPVYLQYHLLKIALWKDQHS